MRIIIIPAKNGFPFFQQPIMSTNVVVNNKPTRNNITTTNKSQ